MNIQSLLTHPLIFFDGGTGTMLQARGLKPGERTELWSIEKPEELIGLHRSYVEAGCDIVKANTFGVNKFHYHEGTPYSLPQMVQAAIDNAKAAIAQANPGRDVYTALDLGPTGEFLEPFGDMTEEDAYDNYRQLAIAGEQAGADCILIETMFSCAEAQAAMKACRENSSLPMFVTFSFSDNGRLLSGETVEEIAAAAEKYGAAAVGFNCGFGPEQMKPLASSLLKATSLPVIVNPNAGLPQTIDGQTRYTMSPEEFVRIMEEIVDMGVQFIGGCCGTTPAFIEELRNHFAR